MTEALAVEGLHIRDASGNAVIEGISFAIRRGGALTLIGETGSGKSLVALALLGLLPSGMKATGTIALAGARPFDAADGRGLQALWRRHLMLVPQEPAAALDPIMRVRRQLALAGLVGAKVDVALRAVDLGDEDGGKFGFELSGGMAQRVLVATALGTGAPVVVADEPTKCLDPERVGQVIGLLRRLLLDGRSLFVITHDRRLAQSLPGQLAILHGGRIVENGRAEDVIAAPRSAFGRAWMASDPAAWPACARGCDRSRLALSAHGLSFAWPGRPPLFRELDLHLPRGAILGIDGPSGCGKTTLGDVLLGLRRPSAGSVEWAGEDIVGRPDAIRPMRRRYQKLHQEPAAAFIPGLPLRRQFEALRLVVPGFDASRALPELLDRLKLRHALIDRRPEELSGGEAQRMSLARVLALDPHVIVADEPTSRLDPVVQRETMALLREQVEARGISVVMVSHDASLLRAVADETISLARAPGVPA